MDTIPLSINRNDETIKQTLLLMGFTSSHRVIDDVEELYMNFRPELRVKMVLCHTPSKSYWNLSISYLNRNQVITNINYDRGESEQKILSDVFSRMLTQTEQVSINNLKEKVKSIIS